ncbi:MAG: RtcB family protein [Nitrospinota bacterium]|nr:RtcB family protein [Nitrospinota bacterium]
MRKKTAIFASDVEKDVLDQFYSAMEQSFAKRGALMPDAHLGYSLPIGGVVVTDGVVVPSWVGFDQGCGMAAVKLNANVDEILPHRKEIFSGIYRSIPTGMGDENRSKTVKKFDLESRYRSLNENINEKACFQMGSLGGGNHFIELSYDEEKNLWVVVHSGSRNIGHQIASFYMRMAAGQPYEGKKLPKPKEGHYGFEAKSREGESFIHDMNKALQFALDNRREIIRRTIKEIAYRLKREPAEMEFINRNHNHAEEKNGEWIHRKGATHAEKGMAGVIPGNMRDGSFVVEGLGNKESINSSSHGAGRSVSRNKAKTQTSVEEFQRLMEGITAKVSRDTLDENPYAYKDIFKVMEEQKDMVKVLHHLKPVINVKGTR